jgi:hypothetical protein
VTFDAGSRLSNLGECVFQGCASLSSIQLPRSIGTIAKSCFTECQNLGSIILETGSKLSAQSVLDLRSICPVTLN